MPDPTPTEAPKRKTAPPRNDMKSAGLYKNSRALELQNRNPDFEYQYFSTDPESPAYIGSRLKAHERGSAQGGYVMIDGWEVVHSQTDPDARPVQMRDDQGKGIDSRVTYGRQILCRLPKTEHAKYALAEEATAAVMKKQIYSADRLNDGAGTKLTSVVTEDESVDKFDLLAQSGHNVPGRF